MIRYSDYIGDMGEEKALEFLIKKGYEFVDKNYHSRYGEIDIVGHDGAYYIFFEVKYRKSSSRLTSEPVLNLKSKTWFILTSFSPGNI